MVDVTGGDLYSLWKIANVALPRVANVYTDSNTDLASTNSTDASSFSRDGGDHGDSCGVVYPHFLALKNEFQHVLANTGQNILDCSTALNYAISSYRATDGGAGGELDRILEGKKDDDGVKVHNPDDPSQNPPTGDGVPGEPTPPEYYDSPGDDKLPE